MSYKKVLPDVGANIRKCREIRNYTQDYLAEELDISTTAYRNIESGKTSITLHYVYAIAEILDVNINALLYYDEHLLLGVYNDKEGQSSDNFKDIVSLLRATHEKMMEMVNKNTQLSADVHTVVLSVTRLVRELAKSQKKRQ